MGNKAFRKLKRHSKQTEPAIVFLPNEEVKFVPEGIDVITVTDRKIYEALLTTTTKSLIEKRKGVTLRRAT